MQITPQIKPDWASIHTVLLDLDGTLLDQAYDNHIWRELIPRAYATQQGVAVEAAAAEITRRFAACAGTLAYYDVERWSLELGVDVAGLHRGARAQVAWLNGAREFLVRMRSMGKRLLLLTNSHPQALAVKQEQTAVLDLLDGWVTSHDLGAAKEEPQFWQRAIAKFQFVPQQCLFADDNPKMLSAARAAGVRWVFGVRHWDTRGAKREHFEFPAVDSVSEL